MKTLTVDAIKRFTKAIDHCTWLIESVKPIQIFLIDHEEIIISNADFGIKNILPLNTYKSWMDVKEYVNLHTSFAMMEQFVDNEKLAIIYNFEVKEDMNQLFDYIVMTFKLSVIEETQKSLKGWHKIIDLKNVLIHLLYQSEYTRELDRIAKALIDYLGDSINETAALFFYDKTAERYFFNTSTADRFSDCWNELNLTTQDVQAYLNDRRMAEIASISPFCDNGNKLYLWPLKNKDSIYALLFLTCSNEELKHIDQQTLKKLTNVIGECSKLLFEIQNYMHDKKMGRRYQELFTVTKKFHSTMDDQEVIDEVMKTIANYYPNYEINLLFAQENEARNTQHPFAVQAFLSGTVQMGVEEDFSQLFAPLTGRQGVYGVIEIKAKNNEKFLKEDIEFIHLLATTAGHAFENARLFQQSQRSISDLRLINKTSQQLNANLRFDETVDYLLKEILENFDVDEVGFASINQGFTFTLYPGSTPFFQTKDGLELLEWAINLINENHEGLFRGDFQSENGVKVMHQSLVALPMFQDDNFMGLIIALHKEPYHFSFDGFRLLQSIVSHSTLVLINARLREELEYQVITDQLTGLYARDYLDKKVEHSLRTDKSGAMILIDIDDFKLINDRYGHTAGDKTLIQVAQMMKANIRQRDIAARWGGEELAVYLPDCSVSAGYAIAERLVENVQTETNPRVTISCGIAYWELPKSVGNGQELFIQADKALYCAKEEGKNCVRIFEKK